jgi:hypothetical protein
MLGLGKSIHRLTAENDSSTNITINVGDADSVMSDAATAAADIAEIETQDSLNASIKATSVEGNFIELKVTIQKPSDAEGSESYLAGGDSFNIQLTEDGSTDSYISIGIIVDLTFTEVGETIKIPVGNIIYEGPENPGEGGSRPSAVGAGASA